MVLRLNPDEDYRIFRRMEDYSDSLSVFYNMESNFTSTVVYSSKLQLTNETTPGFLRGRHLTMRTYNMLHALYSFQKGCTYIRPSLDADENMKEYYDACFYYNTYIGMCRTIEQQVNPTRSIQFYMMLPTHRDEQRLLRYNADGAHYTTGGDHTPPGTFHLLRATTAKTDFPLQQIPNAAVGILQHSDDMRYIKSFREYVARSVHTSSYIQYSAPKHFQTRIHRIL